MLIGIVIGIVIGVVVGFVVGILVGRKNKQGVEKAVGAGKSKLGL